MTDFELSPVFLETSALIERLCLCEARLQLDARWPWIILIPQRTGVCEIADLSTADRALLMEEIVGAGEAVTAIGAALGRPVQKLNVGALGNITAQLHVHIVGRRADDTAWPGPVWGVGTTEPYAADALERARATGRAALAVRNAS